MKTTQQPVKTPISSNTGKAGAYVETHPSYAMIGAARVTGHTRLFNSEFNHDHFVTVSIHLAELQRDLSRDWIHAKNEVIEVAMSESQWANFVCSMNVGNGVPCTLQHHNGEMIPQIEGQINVKSTFKAELQETLKEVTQSLAELENKIHEAKLSGKARDELLKSLHTAKMNLAPNLNFVAESFSEHIEKTVDSAKIEVGAYVQATLTRTGLDALRGQTPIQIQE